MPGRVFVTGGSGLVGAALLRRLERDGRETVALARSERSSAVVAGLGARPARGDVLDPDGLADSMRGCDVVFHVAGAIQTCATDASLMVRTNVEGTRNVVEAAARAGVRRVVLTSSAATIGEERHAVAREDTPHRGWHLTTYERSKHEAERLAFERGGRLGLEVVAVNPASVQGPDRVSGAARLLLTHLRGRLPVLVNVPLSLVDVEDCARGHLLAETRGGPGERYLLCGASLTVREALEIVERTTGVRRRGWFAPVGAVAALAGPIEAAFRAVGRPPPFCRELARALVHGRSCDGSRAARDLGLAYTPVEETLRRIVETLRGRGLL
ncbi:MAG TPA: NAD-dependent epimerase/dehydratase family protein [Actinomycetota bacterium]|jgi:dihydroflavonol-4-reductase|nr:NAD-dependent epimerase/dehydratase family protein [Actinomycetota bacterium]